MSLFRFQAANCKNCYRCIRVCPVKAIEFKDNQAKILDEACIFCCSCLKECPQNAKSIESDLMAVGQMLRTGAKVVVSLAPSFAGYTDDPEAYISWLYKIGFSEVRETAEAAAEVSREYTREFARRGKLLTTACPVVVEYAEKYFPQSLPYLAATDSPMMAHAKWIKHRDPAAKVVFIGPCYAKKKEARDQPGYVDAVLTFEESLKLEAAAYAEGIAPLEAQLDRKNVKDPDSLFRSRLYPVEGGVVETSFPKETSLPSAKRASVSGIESCRKLLASIGDFPDGWFLELNACEGGCINGPASGEGVHPIIKRERIFRYRERPVPVRGGPLPMQERGIIVRTFRDRSIPVRKYSEEELRSVLAKQDKFRKEDELNCGACGYSTCRDKAAAVLDGKAELFMCMPYAQTRAESFAHVLLEETPNAVVAINEQLYVKEVNEAAVRFYQMDAAQLVGLPADFLLDPEEVVLSENSPVRKRVHFPDLRKTANVTASYVPAQQLYLVILHDLTEQEAEQEKLRTLKQETVDMAQRVIENQMRVAQEIAGLLGETTAETKVTLTRLKKLLLEE